MKVKSDAYKQLICIMQCMHFQVRVSAFSCGKKQIKCGLAWSVLLSTTIRIITVVKMLWTHRGSQVSIQQIELHHKARTLL